MLDNERRLKLSKSSVCRLLGHFGLSPQRPIYKSYQHPDKVRDYLAETYPKAVAVAKKNRARLYFVDEAAFRSDAHRGTFWGKVGKTPVGKDGGERFSFKLVSAASAQGNQHFNVIDRTMDAERFIEFLKKLRHDTGCPIFVIVDDAGHHHSKKAGLFRHSARGSHDGVSNQE